MKYVLWIPVLFGVTACLAAQGCGGASLTTRSAGPHNLYVINPGPNISVYTLDSSDFHQTGQFTAGTSTEEIRGAVASAVDSMMYIGYGCSSPSGCTPHLMKYDLVNNSVVWDKVISDGIDNAAITPDGRALYSPTGEGNNADTWQVIDTSSGSVTGTIHSQENGPHNTVINAAGTHAYLGSIHQDVDGSGENYLAEVAIPSGTLIQKIGPTFGVSTRPFTIDKNETFVYLTTMGLDGFQVGNISTGTIDYTVPVPGVDTSKCVPDVTCSHGISLSPDGREIYLVDYYNNLVHVFDVSGVSAGSAPTKTATISLVRNYTTSGAWLNHSRDGHYVFVAQSGDVIDTTTRTIVGFIPALSTTKISQEIDFTNGTVSFTPTSRASSVGY